MTEPVAPDTDADELSGSHELPQPLPRDVTEVLALWSEGEAGAAEKLLPLVYSELRKLARRYLKRQRPDHTLQPTALVHEAYLRLSDRDQPPWKDRAHFYAVVSKIMRGILVDHARAHETLKRGGGMVKVSLAASGDVADRRATDLLALDEALSHLASFDERKARIVELRYFGGLTIEETAAILKVSTPTVVNDTRKARAWLQAALVEGTGAAGEP